MLPFAHLEDLCHGGYRRGEIVDIRAAIETIEGPECGHPVDADLYCSNCADEADFNLEMTKYE